MTDGSSPLLILKKNIKYEINRSGWWGQGMASSNYLFLPDSGMQLRVSNPDDSGKL